MQKNEGKAEHDVQACVGELKSVSLVRDARHNNWKSADGRVRLSFQPAHGVYFRAGDLARENLLLFEGALMMGSGYAVNLCTSYWLERENSEPGLIGRILGKKTTSDIAARLVLERINFANERRPSVSNMRDSDISQILAFLESPMGDLLDLRVSQERQLQRLRGRHANPISGRLHWRLGDPVPELVRFHEMRAAFARDATVARAEPRMIEKYSAIREMVYRFEDDPTVVVFDNGIDRDAPGTRSFWVQIGAQRVPIETYYLGWSDRRVNSNLAVDDECVYALETHLLVHPRSDLLRPYYWRSKDVEKEIADAAVEHVRNVWRIVCGGFRPVPKWLGGPIEDRVVCKDLMVG